MLCIYFPRCPLDASVVVVIPKLAEKWAKLGSLFINDSQMRRMYGLYTWQFFVTFGMVK